MTIDTGTAIGRRRASVEPLTAIALVAISALVAIGLRQHHAHYPACCDAIYYGALAIRMRSLGLIYAEPPPGWRTFGYPLFLSLVLPSDAASLPKAAYFSPNAYVAQWLLYAFSSLWLFCALHLRRPRIAWCCLVGLLINPFALNYITERLTEGLTAGLAVAAVAAASTLVYRSPPALGRLGLLFLGGFIVGYAVEVRPASLALATGWIVFLFFLTLNERSRGVQWMPGALISCIGLAIPLGLQIAINKIAFGRLTPLPAADLGKVQINAGLQFLKFGARIIGGEGEPVDYLNPWFGPNEMALGLKAYFANPIGGLATMIAHVFGSIDNDYFFPYTYDLHPWYGAPLNALNHAALFLAGFAAVRYFASRVAAQMAVPERFRVDRCEAPVVAFVAAALLVTLAMNSVSAVETRFGFLFYLAAWPLAACGIAEWMSLKQRPRLVVVGAGLGYVAVALVISHFMQALAMLPPE